MPKQEIIGELNTIDSIFYNFEHEAMERTIDKIVTDLKQVNRIHRVKTHRRTFRAMMEILKDMIHQLEMDESVHSLGNCVSTCGRVRESDLRILHKANLAISGLIKLNEELKRQQKSLKQKLAKRNKINLP